MNEKEIAKNIATELEPHIQNIKKEWIKEACREIVPEVLEDTFKKLGINTSEPFERQADFKYLNAQRIQGSDIKKRVVGELVRAGMICFIGYLAIIWSAVGGK